VLVPTKDGPKLGKSSILFVVPRLGARLDAGNLGGLVVETDDRSSAWLVRTCPGAADELVKTNSTFVGPQLDA
jgi:hypothetical protein